MGLRRYTSTVLAEAFGQEVMDDYGNVWVIYPGGVRRVPTGVGGSRPEPGRPRPDADTGPPTNEGE